MFILSSLNPNVLAKTRLLISMDVSMRKTRRHAWQARTGLSGLLGNTVSPPSSTSER